MDADVFIRAKNLHYGLDFCPAFWDWLAAGNRAGNVYSIEKVGDELQAVADEHRTRHQVRDAVSDAANGAGAFRSGSSAVSDQPRFKHVDGPNVGVTALLPLDIFTSPTR